MDKIIFFKTIPITEFLAFLVLLLVGISLSVWGFLRIVPFIEQVINPESKELLIFTKEHVIIPGSKKSSHVNYGTFIPWDDVVEIHLEKYSTRSGKSSKSHTNLYFHPSKGKRISVDSSYLKELQDSEDAFFSTIREFYQGPIVKEIQKNQFMRLIQCNDGTCTWTNDPDRASKSWF